MNNRFIQEQINIAKGEAKEWDLLSTSLLYKETIRKDEGKKELIYSYLTSSKEMYIIFKRKTHPDKGLTLILENPLCIPFLFLCRHTLELSLKYYMEHHNIKFNHEHSIKNLFKKTDIESQDYSELIDAFDILDKTGTMLRYSVDNADNEFRNKPLFVKTDEIIIYVEELCKKLLKE